MDDAVVLRSVRTAEVDAATRASIIRLCIEAHRNEAFEGLFSLLPDSGRHVMVCAAGRVISHAVVTERRLQPGGLPVLRTGFVDAVSTLPDHEGRGLGSAVMRRAAIEMDGDVAIGCLQTDRESFYRRLGWETWRGPLAGRDGDALIPTPDQHGVMVLRLRSTPPLDLDASLTIERQPSRIWE